MATEQSKMPLGPRATALILAAAVGIGSWGIGNMMGQRDGYNAGLKSQKEVYTQNIFGDNREELIVRTGDQNYVFTQDANGNYRPLESALQEERQSAVGEAERNYDAQLSEIEVKLGEK